MVYRKVYFRIRTKGYSSGWASDSDRDRHNRIGNQFVAGLMTELLCKGWLVSAQTSHGEGIRTATDKERGARQPVTQVDGQVTMGCQEGPSLSPEKAPKRRKPPAPSL